MADFPDYPIHVAQVTVGEGFVCIISIDHAAMCWGNNNQGQSGNSRFSSSDHPVPVEAVGQVQALDAGGYHACAVDMDQLVWCWGINDKLQVGGQGPAFFDRAYQVSALTGVARVYAGLNNSCSGGFTGEHFCWGDNTFMQLTSAVVESSTHEPRPITIPGMAIDALAVGENHICALGGYNEVWCWGQNGTGQTGLGMNHGDEVPCGDQYTCIPSPHKVASLADVVQIDTRTKHTCALMQNGTIRCWGENYAGQLGIPGTEIAWVPAAEVVPPLSPWTLVRTGDAHTCAIDLNENLYCWGSNAQGQLGIGSDTPSSSSVPLPVAELYGVKDVVLGGQTSCALVGDALELYCWGASQHGEISYEALRYLSPVKLGFQ